MGPANGFLPLPMLLLRRSIRARPDESSGKGNSVGGKDATVCEVTGEDVIIGRCRLTPWHAS